MNATILLDNHLAELSKNFSPHYNIVDLDYYKINKKLYIPSTTVATIANYLHTKEPELDLTKDKDSVLEQLQQLSRQYG